MVLVKGGPKIRHGKRPLWQGFRPRERDRKTRGAGRGNGSLNPRDRLAVGPRRNLKEIPLYEFPGAALLGGGEERKSVLKLRNKVGGEHLRQTQTQTDRDRDTDKDRKTERQTARHTDPARQHHLHSFGQRGQHDQPTTAAPGQRAHSLNTRTHTDTPTIQRRPL